MEPCERGARVLEFPLALVVAALAAAGAPEVDPQRGGPMFVQHRGDPVDDLVVHRSAMLWMGMTDQRCDRGRAALALVKDGLEVAGGAGKRDGLDPGAHATWRGLSAAWARRTAGAGARPARTEE